MSLLKKARVAELIAAGDESFSKGQLAEALARFKQALKLDPRNVEIETKILFVERTIHHNVSGLKISSASDG